VCTNFNMFLVTFENLLTLLYYHTVSILLIYFILHLADHLG
jgi:hypothetical protein